MNSSAKLLLRTLRQEKTSRPPFWFMRQAGRYLPEYKELRIKSKGFLDFCYSPGMASEATLQPIKRFGMDGAIIFSDILVVPHALGADVRFEEGHGPLLVPTLSESDLNGLSVDSLPGKLEPVYEALRLTKAALPDKTTLIGFAGAPWTLACYMIQGKGGRDFEAVRVHAITQPVFFARLMELLTQTVSVHVIAQIKAGAEVIQLFDSWAGNLNEEQFFTWVIKPTTDIVKTIKKAHPDVPVIGFPRLAGSKTLDYVKHTGVDAISIDHSVSLEFARDQLQPHCIVQGNLDPLLLVHDKQAMLTQAKKIHAALGTLGAGRKGFIFNLGHGILPPTPIEHMQALCDFLKTP